MTRGRNDAPTPLADVLRAVLERLPDASRLADHELWTHWDAVVGPTIAAHARPHRLQRGVLTVSVDLRGASYLWIPDLAQKDPLFLTPVLMGVSMFVMQKMTPSTLDPAQQRIMMLMPLMLAGMFLWAPAGLNLYWLTSNLWSILQQAVSLRLLAPQAGRERREKKGR